MYITAHHQLARVFYYPHGNLIILCALFVYVLSRKLGHVPTRVGRRTRSVTSHGGYPKQCELLHLPQNNFALGAPQSRGFM
jgi:hypothetical protein